LTSLNISNNSIGDLVWDGWRADLGGEAWKFYHSNGKTQDNDPGEKLVQGKPEGIIALANAIPDMRALTKFDISNNSFCAAGAKALTEGLKGNQVMTELNLASNTMGKESGASGAKPDMSGIIALADVIPGMWALSVLSLKSNVLLNRESGKVLADALKGNSILTELDISSNYESGCRDKHTSSKDGPGFAQELAVGIRDSGAMMSLNASNNNLGAIVGWTYNPTHVRDYKHTHSDGRHQQHLPEGEELGKPVGAIALVDAISDNGTLTSLDISNQVDEYGRCGIGAEGAKHIAGALKDHL
jgi:hypothetical protein